MFNRRDPNRQRLLRGLILRLIYTAAMGEALSPSDPWAMSRAVLRTALEAMRELPPEGELVAALRYLEAKGYVEVGWGPEGEWTFVRLRPAGVDLVEGATQDPGVRLPA